MQWGVHQKKWKWKKRWSMPISVSFRNQALTKTEADCSLCTLSHTFQTHIWKQWTLNGPWMKIISKPHECKLAWILVTCLSIHSFLIQLSHCFPTFFVLHTLKTLSIRLKCPFISTQPKKKKKLFLLIWILSVSLQTNYFLFNLIV